MNRATLRGIAQFFGIMAAVWIVIATVRGCGQSSQMADTSGEADRLQGIDLDPYSKDMTESIYVGEGIWLFNDFTSPTAQEIREQVSASLAGKITKVESAQILANQRYYYLSRVHFFGPDGRARRQFFICTGNSPPPGRLANQWIAGFEDAALVTIDFVILCQEYQRHLKAVSLSDESPSDRKARFNAMLDENDEESREIIRRAKAMTDDELRKMQNGRVQPKPNTDTEKGDSKNAQIFKNPAVIAAQENMLKVATRQGSPDGKHVQDLILRVTDHLADAGWAGRIKVAAILRDGRMMVPEHTTSFEKLARGLSAESRDAYYVWRAAIIDATPPKYSMQDVKNMTLPAPASGAYFGVDKGSARATKPEFSSTAALKAKTQLLNVAEIMGPLERSMVGSAIEHAELKGEGWGRADGSMERLSFETRDAYRKWKAAVFSAP